MSKASRYILTALAVAIVAVLFVIIYQMNSRRQALITCSGLKVTIADSAKLNFVTKADVKDYLKSYGVYNGQRLSEVNLKKIEKILDNRSAILKSEAYMTNDGYLNVIITQRDPVIRFQKGTIGYYADENGYVFPLQKNYTSLVPIIDGNIPINVGSGFKGKPKTSAEKQWLEDVIGMVNYMEKTKVWADNIVQMSVDSTGSIVMIPRSGKEKFIFGTPTDVESKFNRMEDYYEYTVRAKGPGYYSSVNVKYSGQIVCRK